MFSTMLLLCFVLCMGLLPTVMMYTCEGFYDRNTTWPSDSELRNFGNTIQGDIYLPGDSQYKKAGGMKDRVYDAHFGAIVYPENTDDVKMTTLFAREHGIRPTVVSSGHDYIGRSSGSYTFSINMTRINNIDVNQNEKTMMVGPGTTWIEVYKKVDTYNLVAVGGSAHTVSPSGYTLGGGHSPVVRKLGLAVDQVLEMTMVAADGSVVIVDENGGMKTKPDGTTEALNDNGDLWWSLLGGGGGVYGIVTQFKYKLHDPPDGFVRMSVVFPVEWHKEGCVGIAEQALKRFFALLKDSLAHNWGGYVLVNKPDPLDPFRGLYGGTISFFLNHWGGNVAQAEADLSSVTDFSPECQLAGSKSYVKYNTFLEYEVTVTDPIYIRTFIFNKLIQPEDLEDNTGLAREISEINHIPGEWVGCIGTLLGGAANVPSHDAKSVSPDLRTARMSYSCGSIWGDETPDDIIPKQLVHYAKEDFYQYGTGVYYNEPDYFLENWKTDYWKTLDRYNRLLRVKQQWDPDNLFWCHHCVGSDLVTYESEKPCETPFNSTAKPFPNRTTRTACFSNISFIVGFLLILLVKMI